MKISIISTTVEWFVLWEQNSWMESWSELSIFTMIFDDEVNRIFFDFEKGTQLNRVLIALFISDVTFAHMTYYTCLLSKKENSWRGSQSELFIFTMIFDHEVNRIFLLSRKDHYWTELCLTLFVCNAIFDHVINHTWSLPKKENTWTYSL